MRFVYIKHAAQNANLGIIRCLRIFCGRQCL